MRMLTEAKRRGALAYLRAVNGLRLTLVGVLFGFFLLQLLLISVAGFLITGFFLWDQEFMVKIQILFWIFAGLSTLLMVGLAFVLSERVWFKTSGAQKLVEDVQKGRHGSSSRAG